MAEFTQANNEFIDNLRKFQKMNRFQAGIAGIWANLFASKEELDKLKQLFNQLGGETKGYLSREDIENGLEKLEAILGGRGHGDDFDPAKGLVCN